ncbi:MAG: DMT family transporter, partial [Geminicoccaceae bacterium]
LSGAFGSSRLTAKSGLWHRYAWIAYSAVFLGVIGHATTEFVAVLSGIAGAELSVWRFLIGGAGLVVISLMIPNARDLITPLKQDLWAIIGLSIGMICIGYLLFHLALDYATVPQVATTVTAAPIYVALVNRWLNKEPITKAKWVTGIAAVVAVAFLITDGAIAQLASGGRNLVGIGLVICSSFLIGGFMVVAKPYIGKYGALRITTLSTALSGIGLWLIVGIFWGNWVNPASLFARPSGEWLSLLAIGLLNTTLTQWLWLGGLAAVPDITRGMYLFFLKPVIAAVLALFVLGQPVTWLQWLAILVICGAVALEAVWGSLFGQVKTGTQEKPNQRA